MQLLTGLHSGCFDPVAPKTFEVFCMSAMHVRGTVLMCLDDKTSERSPVVGAGLWPATHSLQQKPIGQIRMEHASVPKVASAQAIADADLDDHDAPTDPTDEDLLGSGYGFSDDVANSSTKSQLLDEELGTQAIEAEKSSCIREAVHGKKKSARGDKKATEAIKSNKCNDVALLDDAVDLVRSMHANANVVLTSAELEEEAVLLLVRELQKQKSGTQPTLAGSGTTAGNAAEKADEVQQLLSNAPKRKQKYACFEDDSAFLQQVLKQPDFESASESGGDEMVADAATAQAADAARACESQDSIRLQRKTQKAMEMWSASVSATLRSILDRRQRMLRGLANNEEVSLLATRPSNMLAQEFSVDTEQASDAAVEIVCVKWTDPQNRKGRIVRVDAKNRVVWAPSHLFGKEVQSQIFSFNDYTDLLHASGAQSRKFKGQCRDAFPDDVVRFLAFCRLICSYANQEPRQQQRMGRFGELL